MQSQKMSEAEVVVSGEAPSGGACMSSCLEAGELGHAVGEHVLTLPAVLRPLMQKYGWYLQKPEGSKRVVVCLTREVMGPAENSE